MTISEFCHTMAPSNSLPIHGNEKTMNLNSLVLANIQASPYFKVQLYELKTYHQVIDEIYYKVNHLEPWEKGSRKTAGQTGMCGGVRGVGAGGIVSSAYCLLYKLYTLKLTRKQLIGLCTHSDSTFIRALGLMYIRYTQPPSTFWEWYEPYLDDEEEVDCKAGGGNMMTIGEIAYQMLVKLEWYGTLFPRIPVPIQKDIERKLQAYKASKNWNQGQPARQGAGENGGGWAPQQPAYDENEPSFGEAERMARKEGNDSVRPPIPRRSPPTRDQVAEDRHSRHDSRSHSSRHSPDRRQRSRSRSRHHDKKSREKRRSRSREEKHSSKSREGRHHRSRSRERRRRSRSRDERKRSRSPRDDRHKKSRDYVMSRRGDSAGQKRRSSSHESGFERDLQKEIHRVRSMKGSDSRNGDD